MILPDLLSLTIENYIDWTRSMMDFRICKKVISRDPNLIQDSEIFLSPHSIIDLDHFIIFTENLSVPLNLYVRVSLISSKKKPFTSRVLKYAYQIIIQEMKNLEMKIWVVKRPTIRHTYINLDLRVFQQLWTSLFQFA